MSENMPNDAHESEQPIRARVPDHVAAGAFSTGVIVMTANSEFILDFVQNLGRPHQIVARVVLPHFVLPQFVDALQRNMELYRNRWGGLPMTGSATSNPHPASPASSGISESPISSPNPVGDPPSGNSPGGAASPGAANPGAGGPPNSGATPGNEPISQNSHQSRQASAQEIYDDLKIRDELLSGSYANAVMIGHGPHEFSFDFITNFYPHSSVSARVFLAAGQIPRLHDSLRGTLEQLRNRPQPGNPFPSPEPPPNSPGQNSGDDPDANFDGGPIA